MENSVDVNINKNVKKTGRIVSNTILLFLRMFILTLINLYAVRIVINGLGKSDYGTFVSVAGVVSTMTCFSGVLTLSIQRFMSFALGKNNEAELKNVFSSSVYVSIILSIIIIISFETIGYWFFNEKLNIPLDRMWAARFAYHLSLGTFVLSILQIPYNATIIAHEEMGFYALISTVECLLKLLVAVLIGSVLIDNLVFYSLGLLLVAAVVLLMYISLCLFRYTECKLQKVYDRNLIKRIVSFSGWTFYGSLSHISMIQGSTILLNLFFGSFINVAFGIAIQIDNAFTALGNSMIMALRPPMIKAYAEKNFKYLNQMFSFGNKFILYILLAVSFPLITEMRNILNVWIGNVDSDAVLFSQLMIVYVVVLALQGPITTIMQASGKIKQYHLPVETVTIMCVPLTWVLFFMGLPSYMVFISMISLTLLSHLVRIICLYKYYEYFELRKYVISFVIPAFAVISALCLITCIVYTFLRTSVLISIFDWFFTPLLVMVLSYTFGLDREEKTMLKEMLKKYIKK